MQLLRYFIHLTFCLFVSLNRSLDFREMQLAKMLNSVIYLSISILGEGVGAREEKGGREARENRTESVILEKERKDFFRDGSTKEDFVGEEEKERAERSLIGANKIANIEISI